MAKTYGAVRERERESYTLKNGSKALFECQNRILGKYQDMRCLCNFGKTEII